MSRTIPVPVSHHPYSRRLLARCIQHGVFVPIFSAISSIALSFHSSSDTGVLIRRKRRQQRKRKVSLIESVGVWAISTNMATKGYNLDPNPRSRNSSEFLKQKWDCCASPKPTDLRYGKKIRRAASIISIERSELLEDECQGVKIQRRHGLEILVGGPRLKEHL